MESEQSGHTVQTGESGRGRRPGAEFTTNHRGREAGGCNLSAINYTVRFSATLAGAFGVVLRWLGRRRVTRGAYAV